MGTPTAAWGRDALSHHPLPFKAPPVANLWVNWKNCSDLTKARQRDKETDLHNQDMHWHNEVMTDAKKKKRWNNVATSCNRRSWEYHSLLKARGKSGRSLNSKLPVQERETWNGKYQKLSLLVRVAFVDDALTTAYFATGREALSLICHLLFPHVIYLHLQGAFCTFLKPRWLHCIRTVVN